MDGEETESDDIEETGKTRRKSVLRRRSSISRCKIRQSLMNPSTETSLTWEAQVSAAIDPESSPEEKLRKLYEMCLRATARTLKQRSEEREGGTDDVNNEDLIEKLMTVSVDPGKVIVENFSEKLKHFEEPIVHPKVRQMREYTTKLKEESKAWAEELERRKVHYLKSKNQLLKGTEIEEQLYNLEPEQRDFLRILSERTSAQRLRLEEQTDSLKRLRLHKMMEMRAAKRKLDEIETSVIAVFKHIKTKSEERYNSKIPSALDRDESEFRKAVENLKSKINNIERI